MSDRAGCELINYIKYYSGEFQAFVINTIILLVIVLRIVQCRASIVPLVRRITPSTCLAFL